MAPKNGPKNHSKTKDRYKSTGRQKGLRDDAEDSAGHARPPFKGTALPSPRAHPSS